jgi:cysteine synthase
MTTTGKPITKQPGRKYGMIQGTVTHFVSAMGTTGTIMGLHLLERENPDIQIMEHNPVTALKFLASEMAAGIFA